MAFMLQPGTKALRHGRVSQPNTAYMVTFVTHQRTPLFHDLSLARIVTRTLYNSSGQKTYCHVVMPDHVHWLIELEHDATLAQVVQQAKSVSAHAINKLLERTGKVWQAGFHDHALRKEESLVQVARYIVANPLRAGICRNIEAYPHWDAVWIG